MTPPPPRRRAAAPGQPPTADRLQDKKGRTPRAWEATRDSSAVHGEQSRAQTHFQSRSLGLLPGRQGPAAQSYPRTARPEGGEGAWRRGAAFWAALIGLPRDWTDSLHALVRPPLLPVIRAAPVSELQPRGSAGVTTVPDRGSSGRAPRARPGQGSPAPLGPEVRGSGSLPLLCPPPSLKTNT